MWQVPCRFFAQDRCAKGDDCTFSHDLGTGFAAKGKGKKGKGKSRGLSAEGGKGHTLPRVRISAEKFAGTVTAWKGKYGWITPSEEIEHEKAALHSGSLFFSKDDIEGAEALAEGTPVIFHICEDDSGLGAEEVEATGAAPKGAGKGKGAKAGKSATKGSWAAPAKGAWGLSSWAAPLWGKGASAGAAKGVKGWAPAAGGKAKGKGKGEGNKGKGHTLPRTRITAEKFTGTVSEWKGKYGWIEPAEEVAHEKAKKNKGRLFAGKDDLEGVEELTVGAIVEFHIFEDPSGLGAEEIVQY